MLLAEIGPHVSSLKAGGVEIQLIDTVGGKFNALETRVAKLEAQAGPSADFALSDDGDGPGGPNKPPALKRESRYRDDPQKGRFGGKASVQGFTLSAAFRNVARQFVEIVLTVTAPEGQERRDAAEVEFYLHDSFDPDVVTAIFKDGKAELALMAYGGFTVGAWIPSLGIELELDLAKVRGAPLIVRTR